MNKGFMLILDKHKFDLIELAYASFQETDDLFS